MEELDNELSIEDFKLAMRNLARGLDPYQKSLLYNYRYEAKAVSVWLCVGNGYFYVKNFETQ